MKSRKFKAVLAAVSAIAVLATAMTGFAAPTINSVTTYNFSTSKASVTTTVSDLEDQTAEVTLLVKTAVATDGVNGSGIAYIDQKAASDGTAVFTYQLNKDTLGDVTAAVVTSGNSANETLDVNAEKTLGVETLRSLSGENYTVEFASDITHVGTETVNVSITPAWGYEIADVKVGSEDKGTVNTVSLTYVDGVLQSELVVDVAKAEVAVDGDIAVNSSAETPASAEIANPVEGKTYVKHSTVFAVTGPVTNATHDFGVEYNGTRYAATFHPVNQQYVIVQIIAEEGVINSATPYCEAKN